MLSTKFNDALVWAAVLHQEQFRKTNNTPYIAHLLSVAALVLENGGNEDQAIAALLHDSVEDQGVKLQEIATKFGQKIADLVEALTEFHSLPKPDWHSRKQIYLKKMSNSSPEALLISLADKLHNARSLEQAINEHGESMWFDFFKSRKIETLWFYKELVQVYRTKGLADNWQLMELEKTLYRIFDCAI